MANIINNKSFQTLKDLYKKAQKDIADFVKKNQPKDSKELANFSEVVMDKQAELNAGVIIEFVETEHNLGGSRNILGETTSEILSETNSRVSTIEQNINEINDELVILNESEEILSGNLTTLSSAFVEHNHDSVYVKLAGNQAMSGYLLSPLFATYAGVGADTSFNLYDENIVLQGMLRWVQSDDTLRVTRLNSAGAVAEGEIAISATTASFNGNTMWHSGNLSIESGEYTPTTSNLSAGISAVTLRRAYYTKVENVVNITVSYAVDVTTNATHTFVLTVPTKTNNFTQTDQAVGSLMFTNSQNIVRGGLTSNVGAKTITLSAGNSAGAPASFTCTWQFMYGATS